MRRRAGRAAPFLVGERGTDPHLLRKVLEDLVAQFGLAFGTLTLHVSNGQLTHVTKQESAKSDEEIAGLIGRSA